MSYLLSLDFGQPHFDSLARSRSDVGVVDLGPMGVKNENLGPWKELGRLVETAMPMKSCVR